MQHLCIGYIKLLLVRIILQFKLKKNQKYADCYKISFCNPFKRMYTNVKGKMLIIQIVRKPNEFMVRIVHLSKGK